MDAQVGGQPACDPRMKKWHLVQARPVAFDPAPASRRLPNGMEEAITARTGISKIGIGSAPDWQKGNLISNQERALRADEETGRGHPGTLRSYSSDLRDRTESEEDSVRFEKTSRTSWDCNLWPRKTTREGAFQPPFLHLAWGHTRKCPQHSIGVLGNAWLWKC